MPLHLSSVESLRRVFNQSFSVRDIAEPILSFDASTSALEVKAFMEDRTLEIIGVRRSGLVAGYVERAELGDGPCGESARPFDEGHVVSDLISIADLIVRLKDRRRLFVSVLGSVGGIVSRSDLQKPPVRMWLFGMVTLIEMRFSRMIELFCEGETWKQYISEARLGKAAELMAERIRRNQQVGLLDCLQFSDKGQVVARAEQIRARTQFESRRQVEEIVKRLERLRNNLAHSQDIISSDWDTIVQLSENLDRVLAGPPGLSQHDG